MNRHGQGTEAAQEDGGAGGPPAGIRPPSKAPWIVLILVALVGGGFLVRWIEQRRQSQPEPPAPASPAAPAPASPPSASAEPARPVNPATVHSLMETLSSDKLFRSWLAEGDLVRRWVVVTDNLAEGVSPRAQLRFLAPGPGFSTESRDGKTIAAPGSFERYDAFARTVATIDARAVATVYRTLHPVLDSAYRALGYPDRTIDGVTAKALQRILSAPVREGAIEVEPRGLFFVFSDPELERLTPVDKHLLRMGPRNTRLIQAKAREIRDALGLPSSGAPAARP